MGSRAFIVHSSGGGGSLTVSDGQPIAQRCVRIDWVSAEIDDVWAPGWVFAHAKSGSLGRRRTGCAGRRGVADRWRDGQEIVDLLVVDFEVADLHFDAELVLERVDASEEFQAKTRYDPSFRMNARLGVV